MELQAGRAFGTDMFDITPGDVPSGNFVGNLLTQTKFEAGKYVNPRTFVSVQEQASAPASASSTAPPTAGSSTRAWRRGFCSSSRSSRAAVQDGAELRRIHRA